MIDYETVTSGPNPGGLGLNLLVFEQVLEVKVNQNHKITMFYIQISLYNVTLSQKNGDNWKIVVQSVGLGFNEWSDVIVV